MSSMPFRGPRAVASLHLSLVAGGIALLWWRFNGVPSEGPASSDLLNYFLPVTTLAAERLASGELPLWNVHACNGIPLLATAQVGALYPGILLSMWLPGVDGLHLLMLVQCLLAGCFMALALRAADNAWAASSVGGIAFASACVIGSSFWPPQTSTITWIPWLLLCVEKLVRRWQWRWWLGIVGGSALGLLAGFPQYLVYGLLLLGPYAVARVFDARASATGSSPPGVARLVGMGGAIILGTVIASVQLLPTLELTASTARTIALPTKEIAYLRLGTPSALVYLGHALDASAKPLMLDYGRGGGYISIALLMLVPAGVMAWRRSAAGWTLLASGLVALLLSDGPSSTVPGVRTLYEWLPGSSLFRSPERLRLAYLTAMIVLSARGLDALVRAPARDRSRLLVAGTAIAAGLMVVVLGAPDARARAAAASALVACALFATRRPALGPLVQLGALVLVVVDLFLATARFGLYRELSDSRSEHLHTLSGVRLSPERIARETEGLGSGRVQFLGLLPWTPGGAPGRLHRAACYEPLAPDPMPNLKIAMATSPIRGQFNAFLPKLLPGFYDVSGVERIFAVSGRRVAVTRNERALPRAYWIDDYEVMERAEMFDRLRAKEHPFGRLVALEESPGFPRPERRGTLHAAEIVSYAPEAVHVRIRPQSRSLLVLSDTWYPGWTVEVDGDPRQILRANGMFRAVSVGPGDREVLFRYRPASLRWGASLSGVGLLLALAIAARGGLRRLRKRPAELANSLDEWPARSRH